MKLSFAFVLSVFLVACLDEGISGKEDSTYRSFVNELYSSKSPDGKKILTLKEIGDRLGCGDA